MTSRNRTPRRRKLWVSFQTTFPVLAATQGGVEITPVGTIPDLRGHTILRTIVRLTLVAQTDEASGDTALMTYGLAVMARDAAAASAFPDPDTPEQTDWLMLDHARVASASGTALIPSNTVERTYDVNAQRKLGNRDASLFLVFTNTTVLAPTDVDVFITTRTLLAMP